MDQSPQLCWSNRVGVLHTQLAATPWYRTDILVQGAFGAQVEWFAEPDFYDRRRFVAALRRRSERFLTVWSGRVFWHVGRPLALSESGIAL